MFKKYPPSKVLVFSKRITPAMNGDFEKYKSRAIAYAWFIYTYQNNEKPVIDWI